MQCSALHMLPSMFMKRGKLGYRRVSLHHSARDGQGGISAVPGHGPSSLNNGLPANLPVALSDALPIRQSFSSLECWVPRVVRHLLRPLSQITCFSYEQNRPHLSLSLLPACLCAVVLV